MAELKRHCSPSWQRINEYLSNYILVFLLIGVGHVVLHPDRSSQVRCFGEG